MYINMTHSLATTFVVLWSLVACSHVSLSTTKLESKADAESRQKNPQLPNSYIVPLCPFSYAVSDFVMFVSIAQKALYGSKLATRAQQTHRVIVPKGSLWTPSTDPSAVSSCADLTCAVQSVDIAAAPGFRKWN